MAGDYRRIGIYLPSLRGGGAERVMVLLANGFAARGYDVDLVLVTAEGPYLSNVDHAVRIIDLGCSRVLTSLMKLVCYLRQYRPAVLLSAMSHANIVAILARDIARVRSRVVVTEHANFSEARANSHGWKASWLGTLVRRVYRRADDVVAVSDGVRDDLETELGLRKGRVHVIFNPIVDDRLYALAGEPIKFPWLSRDGVPLVLAAGRLTKQKDFSTLIRAFARLRRTHAARLVILGEGDQRGTLDALIVKLGLRETVTLAGFVSNPFAVMRQADLFVLASRWEGFGNVLVEAMACGTPVIATDCPSGPAEILENGRWGRLVAVGDEVGLANAMAAAIDESRHPDTAARALEFSVDRAVQDYLRVLFPGEGK